MKLKEGRRREKKKLLVELQGVMFFCILGDREWQGDARSGKKHVIHIKEKNIWLDLSKYMILFLFSTLHLGFYLQQLSSNTGLVVVIFFF